MHWQDNRLVDAKSLSGTSGTETVDLPASGLLSDLEIKFDAKESETAETLLISQVDALAKIEVVHLGTQVIKSYTGRVARGIAFLDDGKVPASGRGYAALGGNGFVYVPLHFGRRTRDMEYALDLSKLTDPKLKIEWDCTLTDPITGYGFHSTPVATLSVVTHTLKDYAGPVKGYIKTAQVKEYTVEDDTIEPVSFPLGNPFRRLILRPLNWDSSTGLYDQFSPHQIADYIELNINDGERIPVKLKGVDIVQDYIRKYGMVRYAERQFANGDSYVRRNIGRVLAHGIMSHAQAYIIDFAGGETSVDKIYVYDTSGANVTSNSAMSWWAEGAHFENLVVIPFDMDGFENLLETRGLSKVKLDITGAGAAAYTSKIYAYLEELVTQ